MLRFNALIKSIMIVIYIPFFILMLKKRYSIEKHIIVLVFYVYLCLAIDKFFFPFPVAKSSLKIYRMMFPNIHFNVIPFKTIIDLLVKAPGGILLQIGGNVLLFMPMGFFLPLIFKKISSCRKILLVSFICSLSIELTQLAISLMYGFTYKYCDIDDIILNTLGGLLGFLILKINQDYLPQN